MIIFDVGANNGKSCYSYTADPENTVYAFEPTPRLLELCLYPKQRERPNYIVIPKAVTNYNGKATFNIAGQADWGCSSLYNFSPDLKATWPDRKDFVKTDQIEVECTRMDTFINEHNIKTIDHLHCDTQGNDLKVLESFGNKIDIIKTGVIEVYSRSPLYTNTGNSHFAAQKFLTEQGFLITKIKKVDRKARELNLYFTKI